MPNHMKYCKCGQCKVARRTKPVSKDILLQVRAARHRAKQAIKQGEDPEPKISLPRYG